MEQVVVDRQNNTVKCATVEISPGGCGSSQEGDIWTNFRKSEKAFQEK